MTHPFIVGVSFSDDASIHAEPGDHTYVCFHVEGTYTRLSKDDVRKLQQWLTKWLGDEPKPGYTDEDVKRLVRTAKSILQCIQTGLPMNPKGGHKLDLMTALDPFLPPPDPDKELIEKMIQADSASAYTTSAVDTMRALLAVVREHDKEQAK